MRGEALAKHPLNLQSITYIRSRKNDSESSLSIGFPRPLSLKSDDPTFHFLVRCSYSKTFIPPAVVGSMSYMTLPLQLANSEIFVVDLYPLTMSFTVLRVLTRFGFRYERKPSEEKRYQNYRDVTRYHSSERESDRPSDGESELRKTRSRTAGPMDSPALVST